METGIKKYTVLPKSCVDMWVESVGVPRLPDDVAGVMVEDVTYRIREAVHNALNVMKHCKRTCLMVDDFNNALKEANTEPIYGHGGVESQAFKTITFKEGQVCYLDEKEVNLRETALEPVYPSDPGETTVKASWLVLEGHSPTSGKSKEDNKGQLSEAMSSYLSETSAALIHKSVHLRQIALKDLAENKKLQIVMPYLVSFFSSQIKLHSGKETFTTISCYLLQAIKALTQNNSVLLTPYVFVLVKIMLYIISEAKLAVCKWDVKEIAAHSLLLLCRKHSVTLHNLHEQLLKSFQDSFNDHKRSLSSLYGTVIGVRTLGLEAVKRVIFPGLTEKLKHLETKYEQLKSPDDTLQILSVHTVLADTAALLFSSPTNASWEGCNLGQTYEELYEQLGERFLYRSLRYSDVSWGRRVQASMNLKTQSSLDRHNSSASELVKIELEKLQNVQEEMTVDAGSKRSIICQLGVMTSTYSWKRKVDFTKVTCPLDLISERKGIGEKLKKFELKSISGTHMSYCSDNRKSFFQQIQNVSVFLPMLL